MVDINLVAQRWKWDYHLVFNLMLVNIYSYIFYLQIFVHFKDIIRLSGKVWKSVILTNINTMKCQNSQLYLISFQVALDTNCDHQRAVRMWTSSFTEPCIACPCQSYADLLSEQCDNCISQNTVGYWSIKKSEQPTTYYIRTTDKRPYCKYGP